MRQAVVQIRAIENNDVDLLVTAVDDGVEVVGGPNQLLQLPDLPWRSPESDDLWYK
jgi:hypothetical protein